MARLTCKKKLLKELRDLAVSPPPHIPLVVCREEDICDFFALVEGPPDTAYAGGWYIAKLRFPARALAQLLLASLSPKLHPQPDYPFKPPAVSMLTPSGRFKPATRLCLSMSDFHPESWSPMWSVSTILTGLLSFMLESTPTTGAIETSEEEKRAFALSSVSYNMGHPQLKDLFPTLPELAAAANAKRRAVQVQAGGSVVDGVVETLTALSLAEAEECPEVQLVAPTLAAAAQHLSSGAPETSLECLLHVLNALPPHGAHTARSRLLCAAADAHLTLGDFDAASAALTTAAGRPKGGDLDATTMRAVAACRAAADAKASGNARFAQRDWAGAAAAYQRALASVPSCAALHANLAAVCTATGDWSGAEMSARAALGHQRSHHKARRRLAEALLTRGDASQAVQHYEQLCAAFPEDAGLMAAARAARAKAREGAAV